MKTSTMSAIALAVLGVVIAAAGIYIGEADDAPGAALIGLVMMVGMFVLGAKIARRRRQE